MLHFCRMPDGTKSNPDIGDGREGSVLPSTGNDAMTAMPLDAKNNRILNQLQQDASLTNVDLAARIRLSP